MGYDSKELFSQILNEEKTNKIQQYVVAPVLAVAVASVILVVSAGLATVVA